MTPAFNKYNDRLVPAIIQDYHTNKVLMLGYMNEEAYDKTIGENKVVFFSRSKQRLWMKGETSGNFLALKEIKIDCDNDCLLIKVIPAGPVCHTGADTCFNEVNAYDNFLHDLERVIENRKREISSSSYTSSLFLKGINKIAQKVGEEAIELVIEAKDNNETLFLNEAADLLFHYLVLLKAKDKSLQDVLEVLKGRDHSGG
jgi:phosphoribosyl-AMP cyclohydrolase / phosphoribosyl-ATP pyrophosphohydrolase